MASGTLERCSLHGWIPVFTVQGRWQTSCMASCGWAVCWCQRCGSSGPWWRWGYGMGRRMLWTQVHFINGILNAQRYRDEILSPIVEPFIHDHHLMLQHDNTRSMLQGSVHNSWKLKTSQFLHGQHTHRTCHPLSMFGMFWIGVYDSVFQFLPKSSNFAQPLKRSGPTFHRPQSTTWLTLCEGDVLHCVRQMVVTPYWLVFGSSHYSKTAYFRVAFYRGQPKAHLCNNHAV